MGWTSSTLPVSHSYGSELTVTHDIESSYVAVIAGLLSDLLAMLCKSGLDSSYSKLHAISCVKNV